MSEFNGKKFYGFSLHNDPALTTTTRNFEFRYTRPEQLERAIQRVQMTEEAAAKQKKHLMLNRYCKLKRFGKDAGVAAYTRDCDVMTQMSQTDNGRERPLSENEVNQLIGKAKSRADVYSSAQSDNNVPNSANSGGEESQCYVTPEEQEEDMTDLQASYKLLASAKVEEYREPQPKWVELVETPRTGRATTEELMRPCNHNELKSATTLCQFPKQPTQMLHNVYNQYMNDGMATNMTLGGGTPNMMPNGNTMLEGMAANMMPDANTMLGGMAANMMPGCMASKLTSDMTSHMTSNMTAEMMQDMRSQMMTSCMASNMASVAYEDTNSQAYYDVVEDSDLEYEMMGRANYTQCCGPRPKEDELPNASQDSEQFPQFIEMEPQIYCMQGLSFLKNTSPIRYTDFTDDIAESPTPDNLQMKVFISERKKNASSKTSGNKSDKESKHKGLKSVSNNTEKSEKKPALATPRKFSKTNDTERSTSMQHSPRRQKPPPTPRTASAMKENAARLIYGNNQDRALKRTKSKTLVSKSLDELKLEKMGIFSKMTATQERIIEVLDKLRYALLEIYVPENNYEKSRRQKNAFEFSVRFSRNFLYPLKGMIEDFKVITVEQLNSASSNDASARVAAIYTLILQSLHTYYKQLRYFLLDQVPQKLSTLIEMIHITTTLSLEKSIFDKNDAIIDCLQERCTKFHGFLEEMHEERFLMSRDNYRKVNHDKSHSKYDLKMFMNDLNMYEPKLVPRRNLRRRGHRKQRGSNSGSPDSGKRDRKRGKGKKSSRCNFHINDSSDILHTKQPEDTISTQIQNGDNACSSGIISGIQQILSSHELLADKAIDFTNLLMCDKSEMLNNPLNKALMEALQMVTKEQVRQVMQPIIQSLGVALDKKKNSEIIETILSAFNTKFCSAKQTEPHTQYTADSCEVGGGTVSSPKVTGAISTSSMGNASKASEAVKQTKQRLRQRESHEAIGVAAAAAHRAAADDDDVDDDEDDDDDGDDYYEEEDAVELEVNNGDGNVGQDNKSVKSGRSCKSGRSHYSLAVRSAHDDIECMVNHCTEDSDESASESGSEVDDCRFKVIVVNPKQKQLDHVHHDTKRAASMAAMAAAAEQITLQELLQQKRKQSTVSLQDAKLAAPPAGSKQQAKQPQCAAKKKPSLHQQQQQQQPPPVTGHKHNARAKHGSSSSVTTSTEALRNASAIKSSARFNRRLFKKRRNPLLSPPPAPTVTPSTSARSGKPVDVDDTDAHTTAESSSGQEIAIKASSSVHSYDKFDLNKALHVSGASESDSTGSIPAEVQVQETSPLLSVPLTCNFSVPDDASEEPTQAIYHMPNGRKQDINKANLMEELKNSNSIVNNGKQMFSEAFKDIQNTSLSLLLSESPYERHANEQMLRIQMLQKEIQNHEKKQERQMRTLNVLHSVAGKHDLKTRKSSSHTVLFPEVDTADGINMSNAPKLDLRVEDMLRERNQFMELCSKNRFYSNPSYEEPWKVFSRISEKLANEIVNDVEEDFAIGVSKFVKDFLELETQV